jgi:hypothetical protein
MSGRGTGAQQMHRARLQRTSAVAFWISCVVIAATTGQYTLVILVCSGRSYKTVES